MEMCGEGLALVFCLSHSDSSSGASQLPGVSSHEVAH